MYFLHWITFLHLFRPQSWYTSSIRHFPNYWFRISKFFLLLNKLHPSSSAENKLNKYICFGLPVWASAGSRRTGNPHQDKLGNCLLYLKSSVDTDEDHHKKSARCKWKHLFCSALFKGERNFSNFVTEPLPHSRLCEELIRHSPKKGHIYKIFNTLYLNGFNGLTLS